MKKNKRFWHMYALMFLIMSVIFSVGIFGNPDFNIHDFCMGLSTEILGMAFALIVVERYITLKTDWREARRKERENQRSGEGEHD